MQSISILCLATVLLVAVAAEPCARAADKPSRPNIVLILADDLGYNDLSCQGATRLQTPNIDRIAKSGIRFTDAHTAAGICCPSRYSVLTGRYPWRRKQTCWASPGAALLIEPGRMTIASLLKQAGYTTGGVGKWHLGFGSASQRVDWNGELKPGPLEVGFDYFFADVGNRWGAYVEGHRIVGVKPDDPIRFEGQKLVSGKSAFTMVNEENARVLHEKAVAFVERNHDKPFLLYYAPNNIHTPLTANARFRGTSQAGKYGDFVHELDWSVGELLATLDRLKLTDNTLVIFTSDNGGVYEKEGFTAGHRSCAPFNGQKGDVWEGGNRVPFLARWPGHIAAGTNSTQLLSLTDMMATFAELTGRTLPADAGPDSVNALPALLGQNPSSDPRTNLIVQSGASSLFQKNKEGLWAMREGMWKLVMGQGSGYSTGQSDRNPYLRFAQVGMVNSDYTSDGKVKPDAPPMQLYDLAADPGETRNLYREHPDQVARLTKLFEQLRDAEGAGYTDMNCKPLSLPAFLIACVISVFAAEATAGGRYLEVAYPPSTQTGDLSLGVTYRLWLPDGVKTVRGIIVHQHGCGVGSRKGAEPGAHDLHWQALCKKWDCALLMPSYHQEEKDNCRLWCDPRNGSGKTFLQCLADFAAQSGHPELERAPWCLWGHSGGGFWSSLMQTMHPERIVAIWFRSGTAFEYWEKGEVAKPEVPAAAMGIPMMCNPGAKENGDKRFNGAWTGTLAMFKAYRAKGAPIGFAPDPRTAHETGDSRYLAIPFFDACLALRLPDKGSESQSLKPVNQKDAWLAPLLGDAAQPAAKFSGNTAESVWLPGESFAKAWVQYVKTGATEDTTPPPAPTHVKAAAKPGGVELTWDAEADFESGLTAFLIERDGQPLAQFPEKPQNKFGRPLFQNMSYGDTPVAPLLDFQFTDKTANAGGKHEYRIVAVNSAGLKSAASKATTTP